MAKKKLSPHATRRAAARAREKLANASEKLARLEPGGSPANPLELESASLVEPHARGVRCVRCGHDVRVTEHEARTIADKRLRIVKTQCIQCGAIRVFYIRLTTLLPS